MIHSLTGLYELIITLLIYMGIKNGIEVEDTINNKNLKEFTSKDDILKEFHKRSEENVHIQMDIIENILNGKQKICIPAVNMVGKVAIKIFKRMEEVFEDLDRNRRDEKLNKLLLYHTNMLSKLFDIMFASILEKSDDILFSNKEEESKDLMILMDKFDYHEPANKEEHCNKIANVTNQNKYYLAVASKAIMKRNLF